MTPYVNDRIVPNSLKAQDNGSYSDRRKVSPARKSSAKLDTYQVLGNRKLNRMARSRIDVRQRAV